MPGHTRVRAGRVAGEDQLRKRGQSPTTLMRQTAADTPTGMIPGGMPLAYGHVLRLQRSAGNAAAARYVMRHHASNNTIQRWKPWGSSKPSKKQSIEHQKQIKKINQNTQVTVDEDDIGGLETISGGTNEALGFGAELTGAPADSLGNFSDETTRYGDAEWDEDTETGDKPIRFLDSTGQNQLGAVSAGVGALGSGLSSLAGGLGAGFSIYTLVKAFRDKTNGPPSKAEIVKTVAEIVGGGSTALIGFGQVLSGGTQSVAQGVASTGSETAETVGNVASGITDSLGGLGGMVEGFVGIVKGVVGAAEYFSSISTKGWKQADALASVGTEFLKVLKAFLVAGKTVLSAAKTFSDLAGTGAEFIQAVPVVGAAVNIVVQLIDALITTIETVLRIRKVVKALVMASKLDKLKDGAAADVAKFASDMVTVNYKRAKRQIVPLIASGMNLFANLTSICGSVLNIVGVATAAAYGAGVGLMAGGYAAAGFAAITKIGAASLQGGQKFIRWSKQEIRNKGKQGQAGTKGGPNMWYRFGKKVGINMDKTTEQKAKDIANQIDWLFKHLNTLPDPIPDPKQDPNGFETAKAQYNDAYLLVKGTGVSIRELTKAKDGNEAVKILAAAIRMRE